MDPINDTPFIPNVTHSPASEPASRIAAEFLAAEMATVAESDTDQVSFDVAAGVTRMLGFWTTFSTYLPEIAKLEGIDRDRVGKLRDYALNLLFWQGSATYAAAPVDGLTEMIEQGIALRDKTMSDLESLVNHGILDTGILAKFRGSKEHRKLGQDLVGLSNLVHERWRAIEGKSPLTLAAMDDLARHGEAIMQVVGDRERAPMTTAEKIVQRNKAYTLFVRAYDEARRAILYLRWNEDDAETILPSLYKRRRAGKKADVEEEAPQKPAPKAPAATPSFMGQTSSLLVPADDEDPRT